MQDIIKKLVDIDNQAKQYSEETKKQKLELEKEIEDEVKKIHDKYMAQAAEEAEAERKKQQKKL